jgi:hypothetical protein
MNMSPDSISKLISQVLLPLGQQWAAGNGYPTLSKLLADEQLHGLIARHGESMLAAWGEAKSAAAKRNAAQARSAPQMEPSADNMELKQLTERLSAIEAQNQQVLGLLEMVRTKMRPLAQALGCCPECLVGVEICPACWGKSTVGGNPPDAELLKTYIVEPLAAGGVPLRLNGVAPRMRTVNGKSHLRTETGASHE